VTVAAVMVAPNPFFALEGRPDSLATRNVLMSFVENEDDGFPMTAYWPLRLVLGADTLGPKSNKITANSPALRSGSSTAPASVRARASPATPASPSQSASPVIHPPVFTPITRAS
jgi:hypothetical protein